MSGRGPSGVARRITGGEMGLPGWARDPGHIVFLNGTSSSGTTSVARAFQELAAAPYLHTGVDHFLERVPSRLFVRCDAAEVAAHAPVDGWLLPFRDGALVERPRLGPSALRILSGMYRAIAALAGAGVNVVVDDVIYDARVLQAAGRALADLPVLFVGVRCPLAVAEARERARGDRAPGGARVFHGLVHQLVAAHGRYDVEVDTAEHTPTECARAIQQALTGGTPGTAFRELQQRLRTLASHAPPLRRSPR